MRAKRTHAPMRPWPVIEQFPRLALHGGTAINLFYRPLPRLSVDIDLTWTTIGERNQDLKAIQNTLRSLQEILRTKIPNSQLLLNETQSGIYKLYCQKERAQVKVEVNTINRGLLEPAQRRLLHPGAEEFLDQFCEAKIVSYSQLFGGKLIAALDRQHPRDIFDVMELLNSDGYTPLLHRGFLFFLLASKRPFHELLNPTRLDQRQALQRQFAGMTQKPFSYQDFEEQRERLIQTITENLSGEDKRFLLDFSAGQAQWEQVNWSDFPAIRWKTQNLERLKKSKPTKHKSQWDQLYRILYPKK